MSKTKNCRKTCLKIDLENKSALSIFVSSNMKKNFLRRIFKTQLFLKSLGPYICVTHEILLHQSIGVTLASVEHSENLFNYRLFNESLTFSSLLYFNKRKRKHAFLNGLDSRKQNGQFSSEIWISRKFATTFLPKFIPAPLRNPLENPLKSTSNTIKSTP